MIFEINCINSEINLELNYTNSEINFEIICINSEMNSEIYFVYSEINGINSEIKCMKTGVNCINKIITDLAVMEIKDGAFHLIERAPGVSVEEIVSKTAGKVVVAESLTEMQF